MKQTKKSSGGLLGSPAGSVRRDTGWIGVRGVQLGEARGAQMNEGGELWRESRAEIVESQNHRNKESLELGGDALELRTFLPRLLVLASLCRQVRLCTAVADQFRDQYTCTILGACRLCRGRGHSSSCNRTPPPYGRPLATVWWPEDWPCRTPPGGQGPRSRSGGTHVRSSGPVTHPVHQVVERIRLTSQTKSPPLRVRGGGGAGAGRDRSLVATGLTWETWNTGWILREGGRVRRRAEGLITLSMV